MPELGRHRVLDRQRVDVARRQRQYGREDASNYLEEAPLRVRVDLVRRHRQRDHGEDDAPPVRREGDARAAAEAEAAAQRRVVERRRPVEDDATTRRWLAKKLYSARARAGPSEVALNRGLLLLVWRGRHITALRFF